MKLSLSSSLLGSFYQFLPLCNEGLSLIYYQGWEFYKTGTFYNDVIFIKKFVENIGLL